MEHISGVLGFKRTVQCKDKRVLLMGLLLQAINRTSTNERVSYATIEVNVCVVGYECIELQRSPHNVVRRDTCKAYGLRSTRKNDHARGKHLGV